MGTDPLTITAWALAALAVILAWPAPILLSRARWPRRSPATAMILWQAIGLAGGLSMIGAMLTWGLAPLGDNLLSALERLFRIVFLNGSVEGLLFWHAFALSAAALLGAHLLFTLALTYFRIARQRRRHRELLLLLSSPAEQPGTVVINHAAPVAYCLPGGARSVTVLSDGLLNLLSSQELQAVLTHENTHLLQRHHLLLWAFAAWKSALPWLPTSKLAQRSVNELIEMLADDAALRVVAEPTLVRSIALVASGTTSLDTEPPLAGKAGLTPSNATPDNVLPAPEDATAARLERLLHPQPPLGQIGRAGILLLSALLLAAPTALLVLPTLW
ncbi:M56 family metallopeptidase [Psychromicrobium lacuslunae]|uniref:Peptidase M48 n=1 Tax=Psychromicrobium lacuslunae TaxID=1618207 RepID=A0A0D4BXB4_9MICC|nr:M56 family metallopeptidase [Psychromicrobium lacuslunae]AJT40765.1 peptidase M48 [Psychromicrobium lacuslunae]